MLRKIYFCFLFISIFALIIVNSCSGLTTSANPEPRLKQSDGFINRETPVHRVNQLNHYVDVKTSNGGGNWTFMVYLDADNNLERFYIDTFLDMSSVGSTSQVKIVVQMDRISSTEDWDDTRYGDWTDCKRFNVTQGLTPTPENAMEDLGEVNMGDPNTLTDFVNWTIHSFPADSYCLVLMDHGSGSVAGVCFDDSNGGDSLSLPELSQALNAILPEKMDLLYFDACVTGMVEVAYQIRDYADIMVASEEVGYAGEPIDYYLASLAANPSMSASELADVIVSNYIDYTTETFPLSTMAGVDLSQISSLKTAVDSLAQSLNDSESMYNDEIGNARMQAEGYRGPFGGLYGWYIDLYNFAQLIYQHISDDAVRNNATQVMTALSNAVIAEDHYNHPNSHGLSIFFPCKTGSYYNTFKTTYWNTDFAKDTIWDEFIDYHLSVTPAKPDLMVVYVHWAPFNPVPGEGVAFYAGLANQGTQDATGVDLRVYKDGVSYVNGTFSFPAGTLRELQITPNWTTTAGNHNITWIMDPDNDFPDEWNETNNEMTKTFTVGYALTVQTPYSGITVKIDGYSYATLPDGSYQKYVSPGTHSVQVQDPINLGTGTRGKFVQWNDGNLSNPRNVFVENDLTLNATYVTQYFLTVDRNPSYVGEASGEGWYDQGSTASVTCTSPASETSTSRYVFVNWTGDASGTSTTLQILMDNYKTVMANYWMQYNVTFKQSGSSGSPYVTVDGTEHQLPYSLWLDKDSSHTFSYQSPVSGGTGVRYVLDYASYTSPFTVSYATTITAYYTTQFYITITSAHGTPTQSQWVNEGYNLAVSVQSPAETIAEQTRWLCTGFSVDQAPTQSGTSYTFYNIQEPREIEFNWIQQFWLEVTASVGGVTVPGTGWHDSGTTVICNAPTTASGYTFDHWTVDGASQQKDLNPITVTMNAPHQVTAQYVVKSSTDSGGGSGGSSGGGGGGSGGGSITDSVKPSIGEATHQPHEPTGPMPSESVTVSVDVTDNLSGVAQVILHYRKSTSALWIEVDMSKISGDTYVGEIPGFDLGTKVYYYVTAYDNAGNQADQDNAGEYYSYSVIPEFSDFTIVGLFMLLTLVAAALAKIRHQKRVPPKHSITTN
jgi:uncharacterized membrane protein YgcG